MDLYLEPSIINGSNFLEKLENNDCLKLKQGILIHSSRFELQQDKEYKREILPVDGEWLILATCHFLCWKNFASQESSNFCEVDQASSRSGETIEIEAETVDINILEEVAKKRTKEKKEIRGKRHGHLTGARQPCPPCPHKKKLRWRLLEKLHKLRRKFNNYPFYKQHSHSDCGAACLKMVSKYWGKNLDYKQIVDAAQINRSGASLQNLIDAAESLGFNVLPGKSDLLGLESNTLPAIAHWDGNHYVVVYQVTSKLVIIGDPQIGKLFLSRQDFCSHWTGYALWLNPTAKFIEQESKKISFGQFTHLLRPYKVILLEIVVASSVINLLGLISPIFVQILLDQVISSGAIATFWTIGSGLLIARIVQEILVSLRRYLLFHTAHKLDLTLIVSFISHALKLPLSYFDLRYVGDITSRIAENRKIRQFITADAITTLLDVCSVFLFAGLMFWYSPLLSVLALAVVPILIALTWLFTPVLMNLSRRVFSAGTTEQSYLIEFLSGITTVKSIDLSEK